MVFLCELQFRVRVFFWFCSLIFGVRVRGSRAASAPCHRLRRVFAFPLAALRSSLPCVVARSQRAVFFSFSLSLAFSNGICAVLRPQEDGGGRDILQAGARLDQDQWLSH
jgi:hypothetical protein